MTEPSHQPKGSRLPSSAAAQSKSLASGEPVLLGEDHGVRVLLLSVAPIPKYISRKEDLFTWSYHIRIETTDERPKTVVRRAWKFSTAGVRGSLPIRRGSVGGERPSLDKYNPSFDYMSGVSLAVNCGHMNGSITIKDQDGDELDIIFFNPLFLPEIKPTTRNANFSPPDLPLRDTDVRALIASVGRLPDSPQTAHGFLDTHELMLSPEGTLHIERAILGCRKDTPIMESFNISENIDNITANGLQINFLDSYLLSPDKTGDDFTIRLAACWAKKVTVRRYILNLDLAISEITDRVQSELANIAEEAEVSLETAKAALHARLFDEYVIRPVVREIYANREDRSETPIAFLDRVWGQVIRGGEFYQDDLRRADPSLLAAVRSFCQRNKLSAKDYLPLPRQARTERLARSEKYSPHAQSARHALRQRSAAAQRRERTPS